MQKDPRNPTMGLIGYKKHCLICNYVSPVRLEVFHAITLAVPHFHSNIYQILNQYSAPETLEDYRCPKCVLLWLLKNLPERISENKRLLDVLGREMESFKTKEKNTSPSDGLNGAVTVQPRNRKKKRRRSKDITTLHASLSDTINFHSRKEALLKEIALCERQLSQVRLLIGSNIEGELVFNTLLIRKPKDLPQVRISSKTRRTAKFVNFPPLLVLHLNRSIVSAYGTIKNRAIVRFPETLALDGYVDDLMTESISWHGAQDRKMTSEGVVCNEGEKSPNSVSHNSVTFKEDSESIDTPEIESVASSPISEVEPLSANTSEPTKLSYRLISISLHYGSHESGHYIAFKRHNGDWYRISDDIVRRIAPPNVQDMVFNGTGTDVYMLFYERIDKQER